MSHQTITIMPQSFENNFVISSRLTAQDNTISWAAKGLLFYLLSLPKNWQLHTNELASFYQGTSKGNRLSCIKKMVKELRDKRYIYYKKIRTAKGQFSHVYVVFPTPYSDEQIKIIFPEVDLPTLVVRPIYKVDSNKGDILLDDDEPAEAGDEKLPKKRVVFRHKTKNVVSKAENEVYEFLRKKGYFDSEIKAALVEADECNPVLKADSHNVIERYVMAMIDKERDKKLKEKKLNDTRQRAEHKKHNNQQDSLQRSRESFTKELDSLGSDARRPGVWRFDGES